jgi:hypothetical protein
MKNLVSLPADFSTTIPILATTIHGVIYLIIILLFTILIFERKKFEN